MGRFSEDTPNSRLLVEIENRHVVEPERLRNPSRVTQPIDGKNYETLKITFREARIMRTGTSLLGFVAAALVILLIPGLGHICKRAGAQIRPFKMLGWDVAITADEAAIIDVNEDYHIEMCQGACRRLRRTYWGEFF
ncbi:MAG: hypothetical protein ACTSX7_03390 [Alphaproteobacteria bacterium]